jgi:hypothetical protein
VKVSESYSEEMSSSKVASSSSESLGVVDEGNKVNALDLEFNLLKIINEEPRHALYAVQFCDILPGYRSYFASVGGNAVKIYRILEDNEIELIYGFLDEDSEEIFYCCTWCATLEGTTLL